jgi:hypothetical protein
MVVGGPYSSCVLVGGGHFEYQQAPPEVVDRVQRITEIAARHGVSVKAAARLVSPAAPLPGGALSTPRSAAADDAGVVQPPDLGGAEPKQVGEDRLGVLAQLGRPADRDALDAREGEW